jgi:hypothetical protein
MMTDTAPNAEAAHIAAVAIKTAQTWASPRR